MNYLPDLIRKGAEKTDFHKGTYFFWESTSTFTAEGCKRACVIGAAALGVGEDDYQTLNERAEAIRDYLNKQRVEPSDLPDEALGTAVANNRLKEAVIHLNDDLGMKRERIASWLEQTFEQDMLMVDM